jgi:hypothetical protein
MNKRTLYNVFLARQKDDHDTYEIYLAGKESGTIITKHDIMTILSHVQYSNFIKGDLIFEIKKTVLDPYLKKQPPPDPRKRWQAL